MRMEKIKIEVGIMRDKDGAGERGGDWRRASSYSPLLGRPRRISEPTHDRGIGLRLSVGQVIAVLTARVSRTGRVRGFWEVQIVISVALAANSMILFLPANNRFHLAENAQEHGLFDYVGQVFCCLDS